MRSLKGNFSINADNVSAIIRRATDILNRENGLNPFVVHEDLQKNMQRYVGIMRLGKELEQGLDELERIKKDVARVKAHASPQYNPGWNEAIDLPNLMITAEAVTRAALLRDESRGGHSRIDFENETNEGLTYNVIIRRDQKGQMQAKREKRPAPSSELDKIAHATLEELEGSHG